MSENEVNSVVEFLQEISMDNAVPKNIKDRIHGIILTLTGEADYSLKKSKALQELEEIADDINLQTYTRTEIWNVVSLLEKA